MVGAAALCKPHKMLICLKSAAARTQSTLARLRLVKDRSRIFNYRPKPKLRPLAEAEVSDEDFFAAKIYRKEIHCYFKKAGLVREN